jgi:hypothetical protein
MEAKPPWYHFGGKAIGSDPQRIKKKELKGERVHDLENQVASYGPRQGFNSKDSICLK